MDAKKYNKPIKINLPQRVWPSKEINAAPIWCSVDLRDGNQALVHPMSIEQKIEYFKVLVGVGFKEIEIAFPSASDTEFKFVRRLIEENLIPDDVTIQVLTQARAHLIQKTIDALIGAKQVIIHLYNSTSKLQREVVFNKSKDEVKTIAVNGVKTIQEQLHLLEDTNVILEYSLESFMGTEVEYAVDIIDSVSKQWGSENLIVNLPLTVEETTPNVFADQVEYVCTHIQHREKIVISVHTHNDRGTGVAASELAMLAGCDRVEGTLFGNGERTGNADVTTLALNLLTNGVTPNLNLSNIDKLATAYHRCVGMDIHSRHPYVGELVYTAFSGSHQDAINKGMTRRNELKMIEWEVPYLTIDPVDVGRNYESIIRINSQSGKGGVAYILKEKFGFHLPKEMHVELGRYIKEQADVKGREMSKEDVYRVFLEKYTLQNVKIVDYSIETIGENVKFTAEINFDGRKEFVTGFGNGPLGACANSFHLWGSYNIKFFNEHAVKSGSDAQAISYVQLENEGGETHFGVGISENALKSSFDAILVAVLNLK